MILPKLGLTMDEGTIVTWHKREGDSVAAGEALFDVETDKVTMAVESPAGGYLRKVVVGDGQTVPVTTVVALLADTLDEPIEAAVPTTSTAPTAPAPTTAAVAEPAAAAPSSSGDRVAASPAARKRAAELGVDLAAVRGSGPGGRIQIDDVERAAAERAR